MNARVDVGVATAFATIVPVSQTQDTLGAYAQRILDQSDADDIWFRLDETSGTAVFNEVTGEPYGTFRGNPVLGQFGLENRRVVTFDGVDDRIDVYDQGDLLDQNGSTLEVVFKTDDADGVIMTGIDQSIAVAGGVFASYAITEVGISGGLLYVKTNGKQTYYGRFAVNDDRWHHLVITFQGSLNVYLDGKLHFRRDAAINIAVPDEIGRGFKGQIMEFVFHTAYSMSEHDAIRNYYAAFGIVPNIVEAATATAEMTPGNTGKGNQKRALALYYQGGNITTAGLNDPGLAYDWTGMNDSVEGRYDQITGLGEYKVFEKSIVYNEELMGQGYYLNGMYYDEIEGTFRYIDISRDLDMSQYDLVFFKNLPPRQGDSLTGGGARAVLLFEQMVEGVRRAIDETGISLWCPQPQLAIDLGIIDRIESHSMLRETFYSPEQGNAATLYDARSAMVNPWGNGDVREAMYFYDTHAALKYRVTASVEGLTDLGGYILEDFISGRPRDPFKPSYWASKYKKIDDGLKIGDEMYYNNIYLIDDRAFNSDVRTTVVSVPPANVKAGTVVTRENATHWVGVNEVANPYRDYATTIVLEPGDTLKGRPVGGKIFVNFMEDKDSLRSVFSGVIFQQVPGNESIPNPALHEDAAKRAWQYSSFRMEAYAVNINNGQTGQPVNQSDPSIIDPNNSTAIVGIREFERYPLVYGGDHWNMAQRGFHWLGERVITGPGDKVVRPASATADATMVEPVVRAEKSVSIPVQASVAVATIVKPTNVADPDVSINILPATARADMTGYSKAIQVAPATAHAEMVEQFDLVHANGEQVVLTLHHVDAILYLLEER